MVKKASNQGDKKDPVYTWSFESSKPRAGGATVTYIARLNDDGTTSCNCPGWVFYRNKTGERTCKHLTSLGIEPKEVYSKWKKGELVQVPDAKIAKVGTFGRVVEWEA